ncbi:MAG: FAD-dependent oxidoreductase [Thermoguttaceae bacterium]|nr:FAD-dependent oxidoreductase [Thermoguttaceae bacterium]
MNKLKSFLLLAACFALPCVGARAQTLESIPNALYIEAESFSEKGGWGIDTQSVGLVGSPYLIAHGWGNPVADATVQVAFPAKGSYRVYARTRNWVAPWTTDYAPGRFQVVVDGRALQTEFGTESLEWAWQKGDVVKIGDKLAVDVALRDLTGFDGRVDALFFVPVDSKYEPTNDLAELAKLRREALKLPAEPEAAGNGKTYDLVVVGGGLAGTCAAISAARLGATVALVQDRPVLGGNGSTEIRVHLNGDVNQLPYPNLGNLTYLMGPHGGGNAREAAHYKDGERRELVENEPNIDLYLGVQIDEVMTTSVDGALHIESVKGFNIETGRETRFCGKTFADCTGDGVVGFLAGADWSMGREAKSEYDEPSAPEKRDALTMGSSVQWNTADAGHETSFPELPWAIQFNERTIKPSVHGDWDWEAGMTYNQITDMERIRDIGLRAAYGHWSYMKNHMQGAWAEKVKNLQLNWVAYVAGKRESRRLLGDFVLREQDIVGAKEYPDASVTTTWSIDLHYPEPSNLKDFPEEQFRAICKQVEIRPYAIPYRCLYSRNVDNLFMAGRDISVTHIALGTIRVMRTGGMMGEVVGMAASICKNHDCLPRDVYKSHLDELKALMEKGVAPPTPRALSLSYKAPTAKNLALDAQVEVSSLYKNANYPKKYINDGKFDLSDNACRWVSDKGDKHWIDFAFDAPTTINAAVVVSGQATGKTPLSDFRLLVEKDGAFQPIPQAEVVGNESPIAAMRFDRVSAKRFRLEITKTPENLARVWDVAFYSLEGEEAK